MLLILLFPVVVCLSFFAGFWTSGGGGSHDFPAGPKKNGMGDGTCVID